MVSIIISVIAVIIALMTMMTQIKRNKKDISAIFASLWFELDQIFIEHPEMHKYFYAHDFAEEGIPKEIDVGEENFELALCIGERIVDVFQYAELFKDSLQDNDKKSYEGYKQKMLSSPFMEKHVRPMWEKNGSVWNIEVDEK